MESSGPGIGPVPQASDYNLPSRHGKVVRPLSADNTEESDPAIELIRKKLEQLYANEPDAKQERKEVETLEHRSRHQAFMYELSHSGKSLAHIQTEWHDYYTSLPDSEKHEVWNEFYAAYNQQHRRGQVVGPALSPVAEPKAEVAKPPSKSKPNPPADPRTVGEVKEQLLGRVRKRAEPRNPHLQSLLFGLSSGLAVLVILLFGFFNERFIAPFITPSKTVSSTPLIIDPDSTAVGPEPEIVIPKINVEIPVVYDIATIEEARVEAGLERGVVHYATTPDPGELGNGVIFGHSANNILNKGKYKFAFVLLRRLEPGDTFYIQKDSKRYVYKVFEKKVVPPTDVSVLNATDKPATFTLITCDPPGTSLNRLVVVGEQISPDPGTATASAVNQNDAAKPVELPSNSPSLWSRFRGWISG